jgi:hypothetical protein
MDFYEIVVADWAAIGTGSFYDGQMQLLVHEAPVWIPEASQEILSTHFEKMIVVPMVYGLTQVNLEKWDPQLCLVPNLGAVITGRFFGHYSPFGQ